jgi:hypothetical protein
MLEPELPTLERLQPWIKKLREKPGSALVITIEHPLDTNVPAVRFGWLSAEERKLVRAALRRINSAREKERESKLDEEP